MDERTGGWMRLSIGTLCVKCIHNVAYSVLATSALNDTITIVQERAEDALHRGRRRAQCARIIKYRRETCYMGIEMVREREGAGKLR